MNWIYVNINHEGKSVEVSNKPKDDSVFGQSCKSEHLKKTVKECNRYAKMLASQFGYHLLLMEEHNV